MEKTDMEKLEALHKAGVILEGFYNEKKQIIEFKNQYEKLYRYVEDGILSADQFVTFCRVEEIARPQNYSFVEPLVGAYDLYKDKIITKEELVDIINQFMTRIVIA